MQEAEQVQQDDDDDGHSGEPQDHVSQHFVASIQAEGVTRRCLVPNSNLAGTDWSR